MIDLPIDVVPKVHPSDPLKFRWRRVTDTVVGRRMIECEGCMPCSSEDAVAALVALAKRQEAEIEELKRKIDGFAERIATQSEALSKRAEVHPGKRKGGGQ